MARRPTEALAVATPDLRALTAERAYFRAERRGFAPGHELEDWLAAECEVATLLAEPAEVAAAPIDKQPAGRKKNGGSTVKKTKRK
jgi:Protein of unknown function (DUF2934).